MQYRLTTALLLAFSCVAAPSALLAQHHEEAGTEAGKKVNQDPNERFCVKETGSRLVAIRNKSKQADKACVIGNGRVYTREEIERTGAMDLKDALRSLDPAVY